MLTRSDTFITGLIGSGIGSSLSPSLHEREAAELGLRYAYRRLDIDVLGLRRRGVACARARGRVRRPERHPSVQDGRARASRRARPGRCGARRRQHGRDPRRPHDRAQHRRQRLRGKRSTRATRRCHGVGRATRRRRRGLGAGARAATARRRGAGDRRRAMPSVPRPLARAVGGAGRAWRRHRTAPTGSCTRRRPGWWAIPGSRWTRACCTTGSGSPTSSIARSRQSCCARRASAAAARSTAGGMVVFQAAASFELFTGVRPDRERMLRHFAELTGMRRSIATVCLSGTLDEKLEAAARAGFDGVELFEPDLIASPLQPVEVVERLAELGLTLDLYQPFRDFEAMPEPDFARAEAKFALMQELAPSCCSCAPTSRRTRSTTTRWPPPSCVSWPSAPPRAGCGSPTRRLRGVATSTTTSTRGGSSSALTTPRSASAWTASTSCRAARIRPGSRTSLARSSSSSSSPTRRGWRWTSCSGAATTAASRARAGSTSARFLRARARSRLSRPAFARGLQRRVPRDGPAPHGSRRDALAARARGRAPGCAGARRVRVRRGRGRGRRAAARGPRLRSHRAPSHQAGAPVGAGRHPSGGQPWRRATCGSRGGREHRSGPLRSAVPRICCAPVLDRARGPGEADISAVAAPDGTSLFFCAPDGRLGRPTSSPRAVPPTVRSPSSITSRWRSRSTPSTRRRCSTAPCWRSTSRGARSSSRRTGCSAAAR